MTNIILKNNLLKIKDELPSSVKLIAVSKFQPIEKLQEAYDAGQRCFGENRPQEMRDKQPIMPSDTEWHFIGHLQTNKIKYIVPFVHLIHSIDTPQLLQAVNNEALKINRVVDCLLEFHIANEATKQGFSIDEALQYLSSDNFKRLTNIKIKGVMGMASLVDDFNEVRKEFVNLYSYFNILKDRYFFDDSSFTEKSMGMSRDYQIAIEEGSTMVRVGTAIFGPRNYNTSK